MTDTQDHERGHTHTQKSAHQTATPATSDETDWVDAEFDLVPQLCTEEVLPEGTENIGLDLQGWTGSVLAPAGAIEQSQFGFFEGDAFSLSNTPSSALSSSLSTLSYPGTSSSGLISAPFGHSDDTETDEFSFSFPDSYLLPVSELTLLRAFGRIAKRLGCAGSIWELEATSPFYNAPDAAKQLPANLQPTASQATVPHHPVLDLLPWPRVRDRIIGVLSLPEAARPPAAAGELALIQFSYDMEDGAEGMRVWGGDIYDPAAWEVGQVFFQQWWFIFDRQVIERSNYWRRLRGAPELSLKRA